MNCKHIQRYSKINILGSKAIRYWHCLEDNKFITSVQVEYPIMLVVK